MEGKASGLTRKYHGQCPHQVRGELILTSRFLELDEERPIPFAKATIISVRPGTVGEFRRNNVQAQKDGYDNGNHWLGNMSMMYRGLKDS